MPKLGTCCNSSERAHLLLFCFLKHPSRRSVGGKWETQSRLPSGPRPRLFHNQTNPHTLDKTDSRSTSLRSGRDDNSYFGRRCECPRKIAIPIIKSRTLGMTKGKAMLPYTSGGWGREQQVPIRTSLRAGFPLRCASVGMTIHTLVGCRCPRKIGIPIIKSQTFG